MPLRLPDKLPAIDFLREENIFVLGDERANAQDIRPLRIAILNLMPLKITTETDLVRLLSNSPLQLEIHLMKIKGHTSKNTPIEHMRAFYRDFEAMQEENFDGFIITGAPVEHLEFEEVTYWDEMSEILAWARTHVTSTLYIVGLLRRDSTTITASRNIRFQRRSSASSRKFRFFPNCLFSEASTMCSTCLTADTRKSIRRTSLRCLN